MKPLINI